MFMVLDSVGFEVVCCSSGTRALELCRSGEFGALICDYGLEDLDGISLHRTLTQRADPLARRMIMVTGDIADPSLEAFLQETGMPALHKPFDMEELENLTRQVTGQHGVPGLR
jgi:CheY-like chemotaxis protein